MVFARAAIATISGLYYFLKIVVDYFTFVHNRRLDKRFTTIPPLQMSAFLFAAVCIMVLMFHLFIDPLFIEWYREGNSHKSGIFAVTTKIGRSSWILYLTGFAAVVISAFGLLGAARAHKVHWHHIFLQIYFLFTSVAFSGLLIIVFKAVVGRARPEITNDLWLSSPFTHPYFYGSFPSGHSTTVSALAMGLFLIRPKWGMYFLPIAIWVGVSRPIVGAHFPSDAVAGLVFGALFTWLYARLFARRRLLFTFDDKGGLVLRRKHAKQARRKIRKRGLATKEISLMNPIETGRSHK